MYPITGLPAPDVASTTRPVLGVKIDNAPQARPQDGLDKADVVFEEVVEGGAVRFLALFQSTGSDPVGPIRSVRPVDPMIAAPFGGLFAYSGGTNRFVNLLRLAPLLDVGANVVPRAYFRMAGRRAPYNLYSRTSALWAAGAVRWRGPEATFEFLAPGERWSPAGWRPASTATLRISRGTTAGWRWDPARSGWRRITNGTEHRVRGGTTVANPNVIIQFTPYRATTARDAGGNPVPEADVFGSGEALFLVDGRTATGRWSKASALDPFVYTDAAGQPVRLARGSTWISLVPLDGRATVS